MHAISDVPIADDSQRLTAVVVSSLARLAGRTRTEDEAMCSPVPHATSGVLA